MTGYVEYTSQKDLKDHLGLLTESLVTACQSYSECIFFISCLAPESKVYAGSPLNISWKLNEAGIFPVLVAYINFICKFIHLFDKIKLKTNIYEIEDYKRKFGSTQTHKDLVLSCFTQLTFPRNVYYDTKCLSIYKVIWEKDQIKLYTKDGIVYSDVWKLRDGSITGWCYAFLDKRVVTT